MFAIFENGGKQYKVSVGDTVQLEKFESKAGETVEFKQVLLTSDGKNIEVGQPFVNTVVTGKVVGDMRGEKVRVVKYKAKKRQHTVQGHRHDFTEVEITAIGAAKAAKKAPAKKAEPKAEKAPVAKKAAPAKKPAAKKAPAKKPAAKKAEK